jgi:chemotaxis protein histidine kinase CheA
VAREDLGVWSMDEIVSEFLVESYENLDQLDQDLVALEGTPGSRERATAHPRDHMSLLAAVAAVQVTAIAVEVFAAMVDRRAGS